MFQAKLLQETATIGAKILAEKERDLDLTTKARWSGILKVHLGPFSFFSEQN